MTAPFTSGLAPEFSAAAAVFVKTFPLPAMKAENDNRKPQAIFFGTGLVTPKALSTGLPFDFLSLPVAAETLRRRSADPATTRIVHYIPDITARQNAFVNEADLSRLAEKTARTAQAIASHFNLQDHYIVVRGSEIEDRPLRRALLTQSMTYAAGTDIPVQFKGYLAEQLADMAYLRETYNGTVKLSWTMARNPQGAAKGLDETFFDAHYAACFGKDLDFAYIAPGRRLDSKANRACPYTAVEGEPRLSLTGDFSVAATIKASGQNPDGDTVKEALRYWNGIVDGLEELFEMRGLPAANSATGRIEKMQQTMAEALRRMPG